MKTKQFPKIEKGIPFPKNGDYNSWKEFVAALKIGNSFRVSKKMSGFMHQTFHANKFKMTTRTIDNKTIRVWRKK